MRRSYGVLKATLRLIALLILAAACAPALPAEPSPPATALPPTRAALRLAILHTNDTWGYLLPCG